MVQIERTMPWGGSALGGPPPRILSRAGSLILLEPGRTII